MSMTREDGRRAPFRPYAYGFMSSHRVRKAFGGKNERTRVTIEVEYSVFERMRDKALKERSSLSAIGRDALLMVFPAHE